MSQDKSHMCTWNHVWINHLMHDVHVKTKNSRPTRTPLILIVFSVPLSGHNITHLSNNSREHIITTNNSKPRSSLVLPTNASNRPLTNVNAITMRSSRHSIKEEVLVECLHYVSCNRKTLVQCTSWSWKLLLKTVFRVRGQRFSYWATLLRFWLLSTTDFWWGTMRAEGWYWKMNHRSWCERYCSCGVLDTTP